MNEENEEAFEIDAEMQAEMEAMMSDFEQTCLIALPVSGEPSYCAVPNEPVSMELLQKTLGKEVKQVAFRKPIKGLEQAVGFVKGGEHCELHGLNLNATMLVGEVVYGPLIICVKDDENARMPIPFLEGGAILNALMKKHDEFVKWATA